MKNQDKKSELKKTGTFNSKYQAVTNITFNNSDFFDPRDLVQVKYEMIRAVEKEGYTITRATREFGFSRPAFYEALEIYKKQGICGFIPQKTGPKSGHKITDEVVSFLKAKLADDSSLKSADLVKITHKNFGILVHSRTIERALLRSKKKD